MTNPQLTQNLLAVILRRPPADRHWFLEPLEQGAELSSSDLAELAKAGGAFTIWPMSLISTPSPMVSL